MVLKDVQYPNRLGGLLEFAEVDGETPNTTLPSKGDSMKQIVKLAFS